MVVPKNRTTPCFCNNACPPGGRIYRKYLATSSEDLVHPEYNLGKLYVIDKQTPQSGLCEWVPAEPSAGAFTEALQKAIAVPGVGDHSFEWRLAFSFPPAPLHQFVLVVSWNDEDLPITPLEPPSCDAQEWTLDQTLPAIESGTLTLRAMPEWVCTDDQAREWAENNPLD